MSLSLSFGVRKSSLCLPATASLASSNLLPTARRQATGVSRRDRVLRTRGHPDRLDGSPLLVVKSIAPRAKDIGSHRSRCTSEGGGDERVEPAMTSASADAANAAAFSYETAALPSAVSTASQQRPPALLLYGHVEKTGGTSVRDWLQRRARAGDLDLFVPYMFSACFVFTRFAAAVGATTAEIARCGGRSRFASMFDLKGPPNGGVVASN